ncbi:ABC transporter substrate-binding protein [Microbacterium lacus]|uniref:ABC transporter substrate-binding protein n=1 Tax=Microbacterium lacus TaxID=415217 RepID=UPI00384FDC14
MAADQDNFYETLAQRYMDETGVEIELLSLPVAAYETQLPTQLQGGNSADVFATVPGRGSPVSIVGLAEAELLAPLDEASASVVPAGTEALYSVGGEIYGQPISQVPVGIIWNPAAAEAAGLTDYPTSFDETLEACMLAREAEMNYMILAGAIPNNLGLMAQGLSATRVYAENPNWNEQRAEGEVSFADSGWRTVLEDIEAMSEAGCFQEGAVGSGFEAIDANVGAGIAFSAALPGNAATSVGDARDTLIEVRAYAPRVADDAPWVLLSARDALAVSASASDEAKAAAQDFLAWLAEPDNAAELAELEGSFPITGGLQDSVTDELQPVVDLVGSESFSTLPTDTWPNPAVYAELGSGIQGILTGQLTVDDVLQAVDAAWDS